MEKIATHPGTVTAVTDHHVTVQMQVLSACASCEAHARCGFAEKKDKVVEIDTPDWQRYQPGDRVTVVIQSGRGLQAVLIAYVLPAVVLLAAVVLCSALGLSEPLAALLTLLAVGCYGAFLYAIRRRLQRRFTFQLIQQPAR